MKAKFVRTAVLMLLAILLLQACAPAAPQAPARETVVVPQTVVVTAPTQPPAKETVVVPQTVVVAAPTQAGCALPGYKFGVQTALTGDWGNYGQAARDGVELALSQINAAGGLLGKCVEAIYRDTGSFKERDSAAAATEFCQNPDVQVTFGDFASSQSLAAMPIYEECHKVLYSGSSSHPDLTKKFKYFYRTLLPNNLEGSFTAGYFIDQLKPKSVAVVYMQNDWGKDMQSYFVETATQKGLPPVAVESYLPDLKDFKSLITSLKAKNPEMLLMASYYTDGAMLVSQARELGFNPKFVSISSIGGAKGFIDVAGKSAEGMMGTINIWPTTTRPQALKFYKDFKAKFGYDPLTQDSADFYDAVMITVAAAKRVGYNGEKLMVDIGANTKNFPGVIGDITYGPDREPHFQMTPLIVENGQWTFFKGK